MEDWGMSMYVGVVSGNPLAASRYCARPWRSLSALRVQIGKISEVKEG